MPIDSKNEHHNFGIMNLIDKSMLPGDSSAPFASTITRKWFWLTCSSTRMFFKLFSCSLHQILVFSNDAHVAKNLGIHLYSRHNFILYSSCGKITNNN